MVNYVNAEIEKLKSDKKELKSIISKIVITIENQFPDFAILIKEELRKIK